MSSRIKKDPISYEDFDSDFEDEGLPISGSPGNDIDDILTDDLLASSDEDKKKKTKRQPKKTLTKKKAPVKRTKKPIQTKLNIPQVQEINIVYKQSPLTLH